MKTLNSVSQRVAAPIDWKRHEREDTRRITRQLPRGVPECIKDPIYGVWKGKRRFMGTFPETATLAVQAGADPADVMAFSHRLERNLVLLHVQVHGITEEQAHEEETDAQYALDRIQRRYSANKSREHYEALMEATRQQQMKSLQLELVTALNRPTGFSA